jgi:hypothetical protein
MRDTCSDKKTSTRFWPEFRFHQGASARAGFMQGGNTLALRSKTAEPRTTHAGRIAGTRKGSFLFSGTIPLPYNVFLRNGLCALLGTNSSCRLKVFHFLVRINPDPRTDEERDSGQRTKGVPLTNSISIEKNIAPGPIPPPPAERKRDSGERTMGPSPIVPPPSAA